MLARDWIDYEERFDVVLNHVYEHLAEPLDLMVLADVAGLSPRHWHRVYSSAFGETLSALVKRLRMQRASFLLANSNTPIGSIAAECGYPNVSSFTRAFRAVHGLPPARYRQVGTHTSFRKAQAVFNADAFKVDIRTVEPIQCLSVNHRGPYLGISQAFADLGMWYAAHGFAAEEQQFYGVFHSDPSAVPEAELRSRACFERPPGLGGEPTPLAEGAAEVEPYTVEGGTYAVLTHTGPYADMPAKYEWLFGCWVVHSGRALAERPVVERYLTLPQDAAPEDTLTEMWLPLREEG
jgi:AraC family transcriptional regulator